jgi:glycosyltransferase involved in cell wall biosynthesis
VRILRLIDNLDEKDGGPPAGVRKLDQALRERGHEVITLAMTKRGQLVQGDLHPSTRMLSSISLVGRRFSASLLSAALRDSRHADVVVIHGFYLWHDIVGWCVARIRGIPLVLQPHGVFERYQRQMSQRQKRWFDRIIGKRILDDLSLVAVASKAEVEGVSEVISSVPVSVVGIGVDVTPEGAPRAGLHEPVRLLSFSRVAAKKRIDVTLRAVAALLECGVACEFTVAGTGDGKLLRELQELAHQLGLDGYVRWIGHVGHSDKAEVFAAADLLVLPSENENFAIAVAEAMAAGLVPIVTQSVAMSENVADGAGKVISDPDPEQIIEAVQAYLAEPESYAQASARAQSVAESRLGWQTVASRWEESLSVAFGARR